MIEIKYIDIFKLIPADYNPRKATDKEIKQITKSIKEFGFIDPVIVNCAENRNNIIIGGHLRVMVAKEIGIKEIPVVYVCLPDIEKERELNLRLNKNTGSFDFEKLANEFDIPLLKDIGFTDIELGLNIDKLPEISESMGSINDDLQLNNEIECPNCGHKFKNEKSKTKEKES